MREANVGARMALLLLLLMGMSVFLQAQAPTQFKADMQMQNSQGAVSGKMYFNGAKVRMEMALGGANQIILVDPANNVLDTIMPQQKVYMESPIDAQQGPMRIPRVGPLNPADPCSGGTVSDCEHLGTETVNGYATEKWAYTSDGERITSWIGTTLRIPIKTVGEDGSTVEFSNIAEGAQAANLFVVPSGYQKIDMGGMGAMMGMPGMGAGARGRGQSMNPADMAAMMAAAKGMAAGMEGMDMSGMEGMDQPGDSAPKPGSIWEEGTGWVMNLTVTAKGTRGGPVTAGPQAGRAAFSETYSAKYVASFPLNYGTPGVGEGGVGPMWTHLPGSEIGSPEARAVPVTFSAETDYQSVSTWSAACPVDDAGTSTTKTKGTSQAKGSMDGTSIELIVSSILKIAPDLKSYGFVLRTDTHNGNEQTNTVTNTTSCLNGSKNTENTNSSKERGFTVDQFEITGIPLPSSRTALTGSKTVPLRFIIGGFDGQLDATVQWKITPLGGR